MKSKSDAKSMVQFHAMSAFSDDFAQAAGMPIDESNTDLPEWRKPLREWWSRTDGMA